MTDFLTIYLDLFVFSLIFLFKSTKKRDGRVFSISFWLWIYWLYANL